MFKKGTYIAIAIAIMTACATATFTTAPIKATTQTHTRPIVYMNGLDGHVVSIRADGSNRRDYGPGFFPKMSPDGSKIAFTRDTTDALARDLYVTNSDGSNMHKIADHVYTPGSPALLFSWAPDSSSLTFTSESGMFNPHTGSSYKQITTVKADGSDLQQLTHDGASINNSNPVWSPDGKYILYQHNTDLYLVDSSGANQHLVVAGATDGSWSPSANKLLFLEVGVGIRTANLDGSSRVTLSPLGSSAVWSPDGSKIVMEAPYCGCTSDPSSIVTIKPDGTDKTLVAVPPTIGSVQHPVWSPDSNTIAFIEFASWEPTRLVTVTSTNKPSVVIIEQVGYPEWAYTAKPVAPHQPSPKNILQLFYDYLLRALHTYMQ